MVLIINYLPQSWIKHYRKILTISYLSPLHTVYIGLDDGSILAYNDELPSPPFLSLDPSLNHPPLIALSPVTRYRDSTQCSSCILALPRNGTSQSVGHEQEKPLDQSGKGSYELWVGQKENKITVLDAASLKVVKFLHNSLDRSVMPSFVAYLSYSHLVYGCNLGRGVVSGKGEGQGECASVYSALYHGQYVTRWNADTKQPLDTFDCRVHATAEDKGQTSHVIIKLHPLSSIYSPSPADCSITALLYSRMELCVGLTSGLILILDPSSFNPLCFLSCHRSHVSSLLSLDFSLHKHPSSSGTNSGRDGGETLVSHGSCPSSGFSSDSPSPVNMTPTYPASRLVGSSTSNYRGS